MTLPADEPARLRARVDRALADFLAIARAGLAKLDPDAEELADALTAFVLGGGKRLRPLFAYWGYRGAGGADSEPLVATVAALELVHASALIHDDVMDASALRRGAPAAHRRFATRHREQRWPGDPDRFGTAAAILLGDLALVWSDQLLHSAGLAPAAVARARPVFDEMRTEVTIGQYLDVVTQAAATTTVDRAVQVARLKSAKYTVERPLLLGAALADAPPGVTAGYTGYGLPVGEAFQLRDDILGVFGDPDRTGKPAGDDLREGKRTYLVATAYQAAGPAERAELMAGLGDPELDDAGVARLRRIITGTGALARTERRIATLTETGLAALAALAGPPAGPLDPAATAALRSLAGAATSRGS